MGNCCSNPHPNEGLRDGSPNIASNPAPSKHAESRQDELLEQNVVKIQTGFQAQHARMGLDETEVQPAQPVLMDHSPQLPSPSVHPDTHYPAPSYATP